MEVSDGDRMLARGTPIILQGKALRIHFGMASLRYLESEYGGLDVFWAHLNEPGFGKKRIDTIYKGMVAGLLATIPDEQSIKDFEREVERMLEPKNLISYLQAVVLAFAESIPGFETSTAPKAKGSRGNSHGRGSISSRPSASTAVNGNSGA